jgi:hypothetical protein
MADLSDVMTALQTQIFAAVYPNGTSAPSITTKGIRVFPGWPQPAALDADMRVGICNISIYPTPVEQNVTRFPKQWQQVSVTPPTLTLTVSGRTITVGGAMPTPFSAHNLAVLMAGSAFVYALQATDTLTTIATALATLIAAAYPGTTSSGAAITLPNAGPIPKARVGSVGQSIMEIRRQKRLFQIVIWADTPTSRDTIAQAVDPALADVQFLTMPDGTAARLIYRDSPVTDGLQKERIYRRDLRYSVEYATTKIQTTATVIAGQATQQDPSTGLTISVQNY